MAIYTWCLLPFNDPHFVRKINLFSHQPQDNSFNIKSMGIGFVYGININ